MLGALLEAMRPRQWVKNLLVFAALLFTLSVTDVDLLLRSVAAFFIFCGLSSSIYLINDIADLKQDREHPLKRNRPLARGALPVGVAAAAAVILAVVALAGAAALDFATTSGWFLVISVIYLVLHFAYSFGLKHVVILDVFAIAFGFVLRAWGGAEAINVEMSHWLFLCTLLLSLFLALGKRRHELLLLEEGAQNHRRILREYSPYFLDQMIGVVTATTLMAYAMYTFDVSKPFHSEWLAFTIPFVIYGIFRYLYLVHQRKLGGDPTVIMISDPPMIVTIGAWAVVIWVCLKFGAA